MLHLPVHSKMPITWLSPMRMYVHVLCPIGWKVPFLQSSGIAGSCSFMCRPLVTGGIFCKPLIRKCGHSSDFGLVQMAAMMTHFSSCITAASSGLTGSIDLNSPQHRGLGYGCSWGSLSSQWLKCGHITAFSVLCYCCHKCHWQRSLGDKS